MNTTLRAIQWLMVLVGLACAGTALAQQATLRLSSSVHGVLLNENGRAVKVDGPNILTTQETLIQQLRARLDPASRLTFDAALRSVGEAAGPQEGQRVYANSVVIASLLHKLQPADQASFETSNLKLLTRYGDLVGAPVSMTDLTAGKRPNWAPATLPRVFKDTPVAIDIFKRFPPFLYTYGRRCQLAGVPVPPPLNVSAPSHGWQNAGEQTVSYLQPPSATPNKFSQMFWWKPADNSGVCVANPIVADKVAAPGSINALGVICQSLPKPGKPSKACYWDNRPDSMPINTDHNVNNPLEFNAPPVLPADNQCTDCHAGSHAFIVMPNTAIATALNQFESSLPPGTAHFHNSDTWFTPMVDASWPQNAFSAYPAASDPNASANCGGCHGANGGFFAKTLPNVTGAVLPRDNLYKFCSFILPNFLTPISDPANYFDGAMKGIANASGTAAIYNGCAGIFPGGYFPATSTAWLVHRDAP